jgi:nucleoside-diphosphate kinase
MIEAAGLNIVAQRRQQLTLEQAKAFYAVHKDRFFFDDLCTYMSSGPVIVQVLEGLNAIDEYRRLMGATDPEKAEEGTIRKTYGVSIDHNTVHGSDLVDTAAQEILFFFQPQEILPCLEQGELCALDS